MRTTADPAAAEQALAQLCQVYWYPLYVFARRKGWRPEDAEDATQGFFAHLLAKNLFAYADPGLGKMRTFLLTAFERYLRDLRVHESAQKRGGGRELIFLDAEEGERRYAHEPVDSATPERLFERSWAMTALRTASIALAAEETKAGRASEYRELEGFVSPEATTETTYTTLAHRLGVSEPVLRQAVSRLRKRFREHLRRHIAETLEDPSPGQIDEELASLRAALRA